MGFRRGDLFAYRGGGFCDRNILLWEISYFKGVQNFTHNFQAAVRNELVSKFSHLGVSLPWFG